MSDNAPMVNSAFLDALRETLTSMKRLMASVREIAERNERCIDQLLHAARPILPNDVAELRLGPGGDFVRDVRLGDSRQPHDIMNTGVMEDAMTPAAAAAAADSAWSAAAAAAERSAQINSLLTLRRREHDA